MRGDEKIGAGAKADALLLNRVNRARLESLMMFLAAIVVMIFTSNSNKPNVS